MMDFDVVTIPTSSQTPKNLDGDFYRFYPSLYVFQPLYFILPMTATVKIQPSGFCVKYPNTSWRVTFVEEASGKFRFSLIGSDFKFEPRDRYRYPSHDEAKRAAICFLELMKRLAHSRMRLSVLTEIGLLKFPQQQHRDYKLWLVVDRARYSWEATRRDGLCIRSQRWYKRPETALSKAQQHIDCEYAKSQIRDVIGWV